MSSSMMMMNEEEEDRRIIRYLKYCYLKSFPPGWRIDPNEEEVITIHLKAKLSDAPLDVNLIRDVHFYNHNPWELTENRISYGGNEFYFFTMRDPKSAIGSVKNRVAGIGYWMAYDQETPKYDSNGVQIASRRLLDFYTGKVPNGDKTSWVMHEYKVKDEDVKGTTNRTTANVRAATTAVARSATGGDMQLIEWVIFKIYKRVEEDPAATPQLPAAASATLTAAAENHLNIIENTVTRVENTATREGSTSGDVYIGTSGTSYDDTFLVWQSNKCLGKVFKKAEEEPNQQQHHHQHL